MLIHRQKIFSALIREASCNTPEGSINMIEKGEERM